MKFIIYLLIGLSLLLLGLTNNLQDEIIYLRERDTTRSRQIAVLQADMELKNQNAQRVIDEVRRMFRNKNFIPLAIDGTYLVYELE